MNVIETEGWPTTRRFARTAAEAFKGADYASPVIRTHTPLFLRLLRWLFRNH